MPAGQWAPIHVGVQTVLNLASDSESSTDRRASADAAAPANVAAASLEEVPPPPQATHRRPPKEARPPEEAAPKEVQMRFTDVRTGEPMMCAKPFCKDCGLPVDVCKKGVRLTSKVKQQYQRGACNSKCVTMSRACGEWPTAEFVE